VIAKISGADLGTRVAAGNVGVVVRLLLLVTSIPLVLAALAGCRSAGDASSSGDRGLVDEEVTLGSAVAVGPVAEHSVTSVAAGSGRVWIGGVTPACRAWVQGIRSDGSAVREPAAVPDVIDLAVGAGAAWAVGGNKGCGAGAPVLTRLDPMTGDVVATVPLAVPGRRPRPVVARVAAGQGAVWVALRYGVRDGEIVRVDSADNAVAARVDTRGVPGDIGVGAGGVWFLSDPQWTDESPGGASLQLLRPEANRVAATVLEGRLHDVGGSELLPRFALGDDTAWVAVKPGAEQTAIAEVGDDGGTVSTGRIPSRYFAPVAVVDETVWFIGNGGDLYKLDARSLEMGLGLKLEIPVGKVALDRDTATLWVTAHDSSEIFPIEFTQ
jgi:hypothetical protein